MPLADSKTKFLRAVINQGLERFYPNHRMYRVNAVMNNKYWANVLIIM